MTAFGLLVCSTFCFAETISAHPPNPTSRDAITLAIAGTLPPSDPFAHAEFFSFAIVGNNIRVDICIIDSLNALPPDYVISVPVGVLSPATYTVESYHAFCALANGMLLQLTTPQLIVTATLAVTSGASVIPLMNNTTLFVLSLLVCLAGIHQYSRRR